MGCSRVRDTTISRTDRGKDVVRHFLPNSDPKRDPAFSGVSVDDPSDGIQPIGGLRHPPTVTPNFCGPIIPSLLEKILSSLPFWSHVQRGSPRSAYVSRKTYIFKSHEHVLCLSPVCPFLVLIGFRNSTHFLSSSSHHHQSRFWLEPGFEPFR